MLAGTCSSSRPRTRPTSVARTAVEVGAPPTFDVIQAMRAPRWLALGRPTLCCPCADARARPVQASGSGRSSRGGGGGGDTGGVGGSSGGSSRRPRRKARQPGLFEVEIVSPPPRELLVWFFFCSLCSVLTAKS